MRLFLVTLCAVMVTVSCDTTTPDTNATQLSVSDLNQNPGYSWFQGEIGGYTPNSTMVAQVASNFDPNTEKVCIFVRPSCGCRGTQKLFPRIMKTLMDANVDMNKVEIWSMREPTDKSPYSGTVPLTSLPTIVVLQNNAELSRIVDTDYNDLNADTLIARAVSQ